MPGYFRALIYAPEPPRPGVGDLEAYLTGRLIDCCRSPERHADSVRDLYRLLSSFSGALLTARGQAARLAAYEARNAERRRAFLEAYDRAARQEMLAVVEYFLALLDEEG